MAWQTGTGKRQYRKDATAAQRSEERRAAISAAADVEAPRKRSHRYKRLGLKLTYRSVLKGRRPTILMEWYETEKDRDQAEAVFKKKMVAGKPWYETIERVSK